MKKFFCLVFGLSLFAQCDLAEIGPGYAAWNNEGDWICPTPDTGTILDLVAFIEEGCLCPFIPPAMVSVAEGDFIRGCEPGTFDCRSQESWPGGVGNPDLVFISEFEISTFNITFGDYRYFIQSGHPMVNGRVDPSPASPDDWPVFLVNRFDAMAYCNWLSLKMGFTPVYTIDGNQILPEIRLGSETNPGDFCFQLCHDAYPVTIDWNADGFRLPSEAEWEKAARGTDGRTFPWGEDCPWEGGTYRANYDPDKIHSGGVFPEHCRTMDPDDADGFTTHGPVGSYGPSPSPYGAYDMAGNVFDWVQDYFDSTYYTVGPSSDPPGPTRPTGVISYSVIRGGAYNSRADQIHTYDRNQSISPADRGLDWIGFRVVRRP